MEKNFERHNAADDLLSQSYCNGIQKIAGTDNVITNDFHISGKILNKRKKAWNNLFEKYSTMVSEVELNINTLQPENSMNPLEVTEQRLPMRKPMSMVQYWVDTGNLLHMNCTNNPIHSDSGSSIIEDDCCESDKNNNSQSLSTYLSIEKIAETFGNIAETSDNIAEISVNKNLKIISSSNSSVDTVAYILANNNITKKAKTIAIVEDSKVDNETCSSVKAHNDMNKAKMVLNMKDTKTCTKVHSHVTANNMIKKTKTITIVKDSKVDTATHSSVRLIPQIIEITKNANEISLSGKSNSEKLKVSGANFSQSLFYKSCADKITENIKIAKFNKMRESEINPKFKSKQNNICSIFFSDSDESISNIQNDEIQNVLNENNQNSNNISKFLKRKKLYNRSDSPAEFTPVSEDNLSLHTSNMVLRKCLPLQKSEHPALETPKTSSRFLTRSRYGRTRFKRKLNRHQCLDSNQNNINSHSLYNQNNINSHSLYNSQLQNTRNSDNQKSFENHTHIDKNVQSYMNRTSSYSSCDELFKNKLKSCRIFIQKLPYKYHLPNSSKNTKKKNFFDSAKSKITEDIKINLCNIESTLNVLSINNAKDLSENISNVKVNMVKTLNNTKTFGAMLNCRKKDKSPLQTLSSNCCSSDIDSTENISTKHLRMTCNEKSKYMIVESSSDESDLIVTSTRNKSVSKPRKSKKIADKHLSYGECSNTTNEDSIQVQSPNEQNRIMQKSKRNKDRDNDVQSLEMEKNSFSNESRHKMPSRDCKNNKNKIKGTLFSSEEEILTLIKQKKQKVSTGKQNNVWNCQVILNKIKETNNNVDVNKKLSGLAITQGKAEDSGKMQKESELCINDKSFSNNNSKDLGTLSNSVRDKKKYKTENSHNIQSNKSRSKQAQRRDKSQRTQESTKVKTSTKKRKSLEIDLSSDEECIIPLKKRE